MARTQVNERLAELYDGLQFGKHNPSGGKTKGFRSISTNTGKSVSMSQTEKANALRTKLNGIANKSPEVIVNISKGGKGMRHAKNYIDYISRQGELELEDQDGNVLLGKEDNKQLVKEWQHSGAYIPEESNRREVFNIVMSMPAETPPESVQRAVRDFAAEEFGGRHDYVMALHTYETDPDPEPSPNPHVHLSVKARGYDGKRLNPKKATLSRWREQFAEQLRENGIDAVATSRSQRFQRQRSEKQAIKHMKDRGIIPTTKGQTATPDQVKRAKETEKIMLSGYRDIIKTLVNSDSKDKQLASDLSATLFGESLEKLLNKDQSSERNDRSDR